MDLMISEKNIGIFEKISEFLFFIFSGPSNHVGRLIWSLSNSTKAQGTLLDLHWPQNGPWEANFLGTLVKKDPAGSHHDPNWSILIDRSPDNGQTWVYRLVWGPTDVWFRSNRKFPTEDDNCAPPGTIKVKRYRAECYNHSRILELFSFNIKLPVRHW